jgi:pimeloyl-ACP methyl ester carboxylesterase
LRRGIVSLRIFAAAAAAVLVWISLGALGMNVDEPPSSPSPEIMELVDRPCRYQRYSIHVYNAYYDPRFYNECGALIHRGIRIENFLHRGPNGRYRVTYLKRVDEAIDRFVVFIVGGPRLPTTMLPRPDFEGEPTVAFAARSGTAVLAPEYLGTLTRSFFPQADVPSAADEMLALIASIRAIHPRSEVLVVASSAGSLVALEMLRRRSVPTVLVTPLVDDVESLVRRIAETDLSADAATRPVQFFRYRPGSEQVEQVTATGAEQIVAFAGEDARRDLSELIARIPAGRHACLAIVYGDIDRRVLISRMPEVAARFPTIRMVAVPGMGHGPADGRQAAALAQTVERVTPRHCR